MPHLRKFNSPHTYKNVIRILLYITGVLQDLVEVLEHTLLCSLLTDSSSALITTEKNRRLSSPHLVLVNYVSTSVRPVRMKTNFQT